MCGVIGICGKEIKLRHAKSLLQLLVHRGQDASGLAWIDENGMHRLSKVKGQPSQIPINGEVSPSIIGSTRYPTYGNRKGEVNVEKFAQPFTYNTTNGSLTICHNGQITNIGNLTNEKFHSDAEFIAKYLGQLIDEKQSLIEASRTLLKNLDGAYSIVGIYDGKMFALRDPNGIRPMVYGMKDNVFVVASESLVLQQAGLTEYHEVPRGHLLIYENEPEIIGLDEKSPSPCMFEFVYFASAASTIEKRSVYATRLKLGKFLGQQIRKKNLDIDFVVPVPDTSKTASQTISEVLGIPLRDAILKNRSSLRTFIMPAEDERLSAARAKYLFIDELIKDKNLLIVDDSIIRGLTLKYLISLLRQKGANSIHVAITNPPTRYPCYYGVDFTTKSELIASKKSVEEIRYEIGADSLTYLSLESLKEAINLPNLCLACIDGNYPTPFGKQLQRLSEEGLLLESTTHYESANLKKIATTKEA